MQALQKSSRMVAGLAGKALLKPQVMAPSVNRGLAYPKPDLTPEQRSRRDAIREKMQYPDDTPVYLRGGPMDRVLLSTTVVLVTVGVVTCFWRVYQRANA